MHGLLPKAGKRARPIKTVRIFVFKAILMKHDGAS
jgi:hypothetical protein